MTPMAEAVKQFNAAVATFTQTTNAEDERVWLELAYRTGMAPHSLLKDLHEVGWVPELYRVEFDVRVVALRVRDAAVKGTVSMRKCREVLKKHAYCGVTTAVVDESEMLYYA